MFTSIFSKDYWSCYFCRRFCSDATFTSIVDLPVPSMLSAVRVNFEDANSLFSSCCITYYVCSALFLPKLSTRPTNFELHNNFNHFLSVSKWGLNYAGIDFPNLASVWLLQYMFSSGNGGENYEIQPIDSHSSGCYYIGVLRPSSTGPLCVTPLSYRVLSYCTVQVGPFSIQREKEIWSLVGHGSTSHWPLPCAQLGSVFRILRDSHSRSWNRTSCCWGLVCCPFRQPSQWRSSSLVGIFFPSPWRLTLQCVKKAVLCVVGEGFFSF